MVLNGNKSTSNNSISSWSITKAYFIKFKHYKQVKVQSRIKLKENLINYIDDRKWS